MLAGIEFAVRTVKLSGTTIDSEINKKKKKSTVRTANALGLKVRWSFL